MARALTNPAPVRPGGLLYRPVPNLRELHGQATHFSTHPERMRIGSIPSPTPDFTIASSPHFDDMDITLDYGSLAMVDQLFQFSSEGVVGVGVPNQSSSDYQAKQLWEDEDGRRWFFEVRPTIPDQMDRVRRILRHALAQRSRVILFPELAITRDMLSPIEAIVRTEVAGPSLIIPGSYHDPDSGRHELRGWIVDSRPGFPPAVRPIEHQKFHPLRDYQPPGQTGSYQEFLDRTHGTGLPGRPTIRVYCGTAHRFSVLICADAIPREVGEVLSEVGVTM
ncbi:MAG: hypothetical protein JO112_05960, partial [Planctomycetes bacterium]|nr:hypothetical protein [Planctomycetota bacterium]